MSKSAMGRTVNDEVKEKLSKFNKGKTVIISEEQKYKISNLLEMV